MRKITLRSFAKINLSLDVTGRRPDGYHTVDMIMQQVALHDKVTVSWEKGPDWEIRLTTNRSYLPVDERNLAYRGALVMKEYLEEKGLFHLRGRIGIHVDKRIPVAAGLAGGSGNGAVVMLALNHLMKLDLSVSQLMELGAPLGADVPFCIMGGARSNLLLGEKMNQDPMASSCARATGIGTDLEPVRPGLDAFVVLTKPSIRVSTREVYQGLELDKIEEHPDNRELMEGLRENNLFKVTKNMVNLLEIYTLKRYPIVVYTKNKVSETGNPLKVLMSGSGPTIFAIYTNRNKAESSKESLKKINRETYLTRTTL